MIQSAVPQEFTRVIGRFDSGKPGPCLVCAAGLHGNEPAGVCGLQRVFEQLNAAPPTFRGQLIGLCGNLAALRSRDRRQRRPLFSCRSASATGSRSVSLQLQRRKGDLVVLDGGG